MRTEPEILADADPRSPFSNGSQFEIWADRWCYDCANDNGNDDSSAALYCPILSVALIGNGGRPAWPVEWTRARHHFTTVDGKPEFYETVDTCTEFEERRDDPPDDPEPEPTPSPVCDGQLDLIDAYLDTAIGELSKAPVTA